jgi:putative CocE/NonD family hydrolase
MAGGAFDQREASGIFGSQPPYRPLAERADVLVFQTPPLEQALELTGPVEVRLWVSSDCPDTDFTAKLVDVYPPNEDYPDGYAMNITNGILRLRYRDSWSQPSLMTPGEIYRICIRPSPTSNLFQAGHRVRLDISSSNFPHFDLNFNTGEPEGRATHVRQARNRVFVDRLRASFVILPVMPSG